jgi:hypothetical protein
MWREVAAHAARLRARSVAPVVGAAQKEYHENRAFWYRSMKFGTDLLKGISFDLARMTLENFD